MITTNQVEDNIGFLSQSCIQGLGYRLPSALTVLTLVTPVQDAHVCGLPNPVASQGTWAAGDYEHVLTPGQAVL